MRYMMAAVLLMISCRESLVDSRDLQSETRLIGSWVLDDDWPGGYVMVRLQFSPNHTVRIDNQFIGVPMNYRYWVDQNTLFLSRTLDDQTVEEFSYDIIELDEEELVLEYDAGGGVVQRKFSRL